MERSKNEAEAYANDVIPRARGEAQKILQAAEAYKKQVVAKAEGEASRFVSIFNEYDKAKEVTQERMYLETMEKVLADIEKVIICLLYTSPSPRDATLSRMPSSA